MKLKNAVRKLSLRREILTKRLIKFGDTRDGMYHSLMAEKCALDVALMLANAEFGRSGNTNYPVDKWIV